MFVLGGDKFAHMTVFMARFADENIDKVIQATKQSLGAIRSFNCEHVGYFMTEGRYLEVSYRKSKQFTQLQETLISAISKFRINLGEPYEEGYFAPYNQEQRGNAQETGYDLARNLYRPHITLTRYEKGKVPNLLPALPEVNLSFELSKVCIYRADDNGAVYDKLAEFQIR
jgi:2'-5' RNA ligase